MKKVRLNLEYPLQVRSANIVWQSISSDHALQRWLADVVDERDGKMSFTWGQPWTAHHTLTAYIVERKPLSHIKFRWVDEEDDEAYWEMRIGKSELTGLVCIYVTDYALQEDLDDLESLWEDNMERLHTATGL